MPIPSRQDKLKDIKLIVTKLKVTELSWPEYKEAGGLYTQHQIFYGGDTWKSLCYELGIKDKPQNTPKDKSEYFKRLKTVRLRPIWKSCPVKGEGLDNMVRLNKVPHASSNEYRPTRIKRSKTHFPVFVCAVRLWVSNVPIRNCSTAGVQAHLSYLLRSIMQNEGMLLLRHALVMAGKP